MGREEIIRRILLQILLLRHNCSNELPVDKLINKYLEALEPIGVSTSAKKVLSDRRSIMRSLHALWNAGKIVRTASGVRLTSLGKKFVQRDYVSILTNDFPEFVLPEAA